MIFNDLFALQKIGINYQFAENSLRIIYTNLTQFHTYYNCVKWAKLHYFGKECLKNLDFVRVLFWEAKKHLIFDFMEFQFQI